MSLTLTLILVVATTSTLSISNSLWSNKNRNRNLNFFEVKNSINDLRYFNVGVLMASKLDSPFDLERCGPAVDLALEEINEKFLTKHRIRLTKVQARFVCFYLCFVFLCDDVLLSARTSFISLVFYLNVIKIVLK